MYLTEGHGPWLISCKYHKIIKFYLKAINVFRRTTKFPRQSQSDYFLWMEEVYLVYMIVKSPNWLMPHRYFSDNPFLRKQTQASGSALWRKAARTVLKKKSFSFSMYDIIFQRFLILLSHFVSRPTYFTINRRLKTIRIASDCIFLVLSFGVRRFLTTQAPQAFFT